jgi:hypothetical protein
VEPATNEPLPLELPETEPAVTCWYCGSDRGPFEREHQLPVSRGGGETGATALVWADARCNALKGPLDVEEFREGLAERLGLDPAQVVFAGEATPERPATRLQAVRSLQADRSVVRIDPIAGDELNKAWRWLRAALDPNLTKRDVATEAILSHLAELRARYVGEDEWPDPGLYLFEVEDRPLPTGRRELSRTRRVLQAREHTKVAGELLVWARAALQYRRRHGQPELTLFEWVSEAFAEKLERESRHHPGYPTFEKAVGSSTSVSGVTPVAPGDNGRHPSGGTS